MKENDDPGIDLQGESNSLPENFYEDILYLEIILETDRNFEVIQRLIILYKVFKILMRLE